MEDLLEVASEEDLEDLLEDDSEEDLEDLLEVDSEAEEDLEDLLEVDSEGHAPTVVMATKQRRRGREIFIVFEAKREGSNFLCDMIHMKVKLWEQSALESVAEQKEARRNENTTIVANSA